LIITRNTSRFQDCCLIYSYLFNFKGHIATFQNLAPIAANCCPGQLPLFVSRLPPPP